MEKLIESRGTIRYSFKEGYGYRLVVDVDPEIARLARYFVPKSVPLNVPRYPAHITVIRREIPPNLERWGAFEGKRITFRYSPLLRSGKTYWWLNAYSQFLREVRESVGLPPHSTWTRPPDGTECFHITIGNTK